jgi:tRNA (guanine-N7-)-methyltransferase
MGFDFIELTKKYPFPEKRPRHHVAPYLYVPFSNLKVIPVNYPRPVEKIDWNVVFMNGKPPNFLDIGSGRGKFLFEFALKNPKKNILGIEIRRNCVEWLESVISGEKFENAGILWYNVLNGLSFIENESLEAIFYLFPDPWPKSRHSKRRAMNQEVLNELSLKLIPSGKIYFATDIWEIHNYHIEMLTQKNKLKYSELPFNYDWDLPKTNKEISCLQRNKPYFRIIAEKA